MAQKHRAPASHISRLSRMSAWPWNVRYTTSAVIATSAAASAGRISARPGITVWGAITRTNVKATSPQKASRLSPPGRSCGAPAPTTPAETGSGRHQPTRAPTTLWSMTCPSP
jgi:hypothetical protein